MEEKKEVKFKRRKILIDKKMQLKYAFMIGGVLIAMLLLVEYHTYLTIQSILPNILSSAIGKQVRQIHLWLIVNSFIYTALVAVVSVYISHKIAGPVFKLKKQLREIIDSGDTNKKIFLRKGDELADLAAVINELLEKMSVKK
ncbi:MAG: hypothetical protein WC947_06515 [Elusimicrobiota bacterium]